MTETSVIKNSREHFRSEMERSFQILVDRFKSRTDQFKKDHPSAVGDDRSNWSDEEVLVLADEVGYAVNQIREKLQHMDVPDDYLLGEWQRTLNDIHFRRLQARESFILARQEKKRRERTTVLDSASYKDIIIKLSQKVADYLREGKFPQAEKVRQEILKLQISQQQLEIVQNMEACGVPLTEAEKLAITAELSQALTKADEPYGYLSNLDRSADGRRLNPELAVYAESMNQMYTAMTAVVDRVKENLDKHGVMNVGDVVTYQDVTIDDPEHPEQKLTSRVMTEVTGVVWGENIKVKFNPINQKVENTQPLSNEVLMVKNGGSLKVADAVRNVGTYLGFSEEDVVAFFDIGTESNLKNWLNIVKTFTDFMTSGQQGESLEPGLKSFNDLTSAEKKLVVFALMTANGCWKISSEDVAYLEAKEEFDKQDAESAQSFQVIYEEKVKKRIEKVGSYGSFREMAISKSWTEVAKDLFQVSQSLLQVYLHPNWEAGQDDIIPTYTRTTAEAPLLNRAAA